MKNSINEFIRACTIGEKAVVHTGGGEMEDKQ